MMMMIDALVAKRMCLLAERPVIPKYFGTLSFTEITLCTCILTVMSKQFEKKNLFRIGNRKTFSRHEFHM